MNTPQSFQQFLANTSVQVEIWGFLVNLLLSAVLAFILSRFYVRFGDALSNRRSFAKNFMLITMTTMLIISIVKSSLALSLGLVGALSIVRFRAAIKEPEELSYLFLAIAIGLGFGADQGIITLIAFAFILGILLLKNYSGRKEKNQNLYLTVASDGGQKIDIEQIVSVLKEHCSSVNLKRFDESGRSLEASFLVEFDDFKNLTNSKNSLRKLDDSLKISFLDNKGIY